MNQARSIDAGARGRMLGGSRVWPYLQLMRPANVVTANADILAGFAAASGAAGKLPWLLAAASGLYAGGVVLNDVLDSALDQSERPERPIPSGRVTKRSAAVLGIILLAVAMACASAASFASALLALAVALCAVGYDAWGKHKTFIGPINMGLCRGLNLMLGVSAAPVMLGRL